MFTSRYFRAPEWSYFLFGPRGTGKSTYLEHYYAEEDCLWLDLLDGDTERVYSARPERLADLVAGNPDAKTVIIDEVQRVPSLLPVVHKLIEKKLGLVFVLTGSSARKLKRASTDLLAGRAVQRMLHPYMAIELGERFNLDAALQYGMLPLVHAADDPKDVLSAYVGMYLQQEVKAEGLVRNLADFSRFLEVVSFSHGNTLTVTNIAREAGVKRKTVENYISVLEDLMLAKQLPVFTRRAQRELVAHPKFYLFDAGVYRSLRPKGPFDKVSEINGAGLEGLVWQHLLAWVDYTSAEHNLYYWRTKSKVEVDFVVYGEFGLWGIEVKNTDQISSDDLKGLKTFQHDYPVAKILLLYRGKEQIKFNDVLCMPVDKFLLQLKPDDAIF